MATINTTSYSPHEWQAYILPETTVGTQNITTMKPMNVDKPITITENSFMVTDNRSRTGTAAGSGRTRKSADWFVEDKGQLKTITVSGIADKVIFPILCENAVGIAEASGTIDIPYNYGVTGIEAGFLMGKAAVSDNIHTLTFALLSPIDAETIVYPGCVVSELTWEDNVANEGGRRTFSATLITKGIMAVNQTLATNTATMSTAYYSVWDYLEAQTLIASNEIALARLSITIAGNPRISGVGTNGIGQMYNRGVPIIDVTGEVDCKWDTNTNSLFEKYSTSADVVIDITDHAVLASATLGILCTYARISSDVNLIDADGESYITIPFTATAFTSGDIAQIPV